MNFRKAIIAIYSGKKVSLPEFEGYWFKGEDDGISVYTKDDKVTNTPLFKQYCDREDWEVVEGKTSPTQPLLQNLSFGDAIEAMKVGYCVARNAWRNYSNHPLVLKQIPAEIDGLIVQKIQSLPNSYKDKVFKDGNYKAHISYQDQMLIIDTFGNATSYIPSTEDIFAKDWKVI